MSFSLVRMWGHYGGLFRVTRNLLDEFGEKRVLDTPISEQAFVGMALGAATVGMRPIVELMYMDFTLVAADQIFNQIAKYAYMSGGLLNVPPGDPGSTGRGQALRFPAQPVGREPLRALSRHKGCCARHTLRR